VPAIGSDLKEDRGDNCRCFKEQFGVTPGQFMNEIPQRKD